MRCLNASLNAADLPSRRRHIERPRVSHVARVAQERSDAAASTVPSSTDRPAAPSATGSDPSSSHVAAGAAAVVAGAGLSGFPDGQHFARHGFEGSMQGVPVAEPPDRAAAAALAGNGAGVASQTHSAYDQQGDNGTPSSSGYEDLSYISSGFNASSSSGPGSSSGYMNRQWAGETSSSSSQPGWQPPNYRRSGLRLRSKRVLQVAEKLQQSGRNLIAEELQSYMASSTSSSTEEAAAAEDRDEHLDAFIEQMLCPKTSVWKRSDTHAGAATDSREAIDPDLLANIHTAPLEQVRQQQEKLVGNGQLLAALSLLEEAAAAGRRDVMHNTAHKAFLRAAGKRSNTAAVLRFLQLLPADFANAATYNLALKACADSRDLRSAMRVVDIMGIRQVPTDFIHFTTLIAVCASAGDANQAFAVFQKAKAAEQQIAAAAAAASAAAGADSRQQKAAGKAAPKMDGHVYGALIAACAQAIRVRSSDLREQLVILERAFQVLQEAEDAGVFLETPAWNALLMCAGRCRQLQRCFEVLDRMTAAGVPSNSITYTCLIEAAVLSGDVDMAQRVFARAMAAGVTNSVQLYTAAINACMTDDHINFDAAWEIYTTMQRHGVEPDDLLYGHLIAIAGRCRKLEVAFNLLEDMRASGLTPSTPTCSALIYACLQNNNFAAARKVYDTLIARGVPPHISQYNSLMEQYALRFQLGNVVSVLTNMIAGGVQPNANTFRILLLACQRTDQAELAFELYQIMKARGLQPRLNNAHSICYTLLTTCFGKIRKAWWPGGYPPKPTASMGPYSNLPGLRPAEARQLLHVLQPGSFQGGKGSSSGGAAAGGSGRQQQQARRFMFLDNADNINWPVLALTTYRDFISWGYKPHLEVLDRLLSCLRLQLPKQAPRPAAELQQRALQLQAQLTALPHPDAPGDGPGSGFGAAQQQQAGTVAGPGSTQDGQQQQGQQQGQWLSTAALLRDLASQRRAQSAEERPYEVPFDKRAIDAVGDAISMGILPALKLDAPLTVDMRSFPPCVAEAYVHLLMSTIESRAASALGEGKRQPVAQRVRLIVPAFDHNYVMWPSYVEKLYVHYNEQLLARQAQLRAEAMAARARAAALAAQSLSVDSDDEEDISSEQLLMTFGGPAAAAVAAAAGGAGALLGPNGQPTAASLAAAAAAGGRGRRGGMMRSWDVNDFGDDLLGADFTGYTAALTSSQPGVATAAHGVYIAGAVTGLAAAATFRRLKAYARVDSASGAIRLDPQEVNRWLNAKQRYEEERRRVARDAEIAAAGYSSALPYYQQQQQQQQQGQAWMSAGTNISWQQQQVVPQPPQQQQQQAGAEGLYQPSPQQQQQQHLQQAGPQQPPAQQQQQQQQPRMPGFGMQGPPGGMSSLGQSARDIRLGMAPAAAARLRRPNGANDQQQQQQQGQAYRPPQAPAQQQQQQVAFGEPSSGTASTGPTSSSSSSSSSKGSGRSRRSRAAAGSPTSSTDQH